jgi:hypothetical protein
MAGIQASMDWTVGMMTCPYRDQCREKHKITAPTYMCGFEIAGTVSECPKNRRRDEHNRPHPQNDT